MSKKLIKFICSWYLHSKTFAMKISKIGHSDVPTRPHSIYLRVCLMPSSTSFSAPGRDLIIINDYVYTINSLGQVFYLIKMNTYIVDRSIWQKKKSNRTGVMSHVVPNLIKKLTKGTIYIHWKNTLCFLKQKFDLNHKISECISRQMSQKKVCLNLAHF